MGRSPEGCRMVSPCWSVSRTAAIGASALLVLVLAGCGRRDERRSASARSRLAVGGTARSTQVWLPGSPFTSSAYFESDTRQHVWVADVTGDGIDDLVGIELMSGDVNVARGTGAAFEEAVRVRSTVFGERPAGDARLPWFTTSYRQRVWVTDVTGDGRADLVGVDDDGDVHLYRASDLGFDDLTVSPSPFAPSAGWFEPFDGPDGHHPTRVWIADVTGDRAADLVGIDTATGQIRISAGTGSGFQDGPSSASEFTSAQGWFSTSFHDRIWIADATGDGIADVVGIASDGRVYVARAIPGQGFAWPPFVASTVFRSDDATGNWFDPALPTRIWVADVSGDGIADIVGIVPNARHDGDICVARGTGSGFVQKVWLHGSTFRLDGQAGLPSFDERTWLTDVTGDGRADIVGIDRNGGVWVSRAASASATAAARANHFFLPSVLVAQVEDFSPDSYKGRIWLADVTGDGVPDVVAVAPGDAVRLDGDVTWTQVLPTAVASVSPVTREMVNATGPSAIAVRFTRSVDRLDAASVTMTETIGGTSSVLAPGSASCQRKTCTFAVQLVPGSDSDVTVRTSIEGSALADRWGQPVDRNGDGVLQPQDAAVRIEHLSRSLLAGTASVDIAPTPWIPALDAAPSWDFTLGPPTPPFPAAPSAFPSNTSYCFPYHWFPVWPDERCAPWRKNGSPPLKARVVTLGNAARTLVLVSVDLIGINPGRLRALVTARTGIPDENIIVTATHAHQVPRNLLLYRSPTFEDRDFPGPDGSPYLAWVEDRIASAVSTALDGMVPATLTVGTTTVPGLQRDRDGEGVDSTLAAVALGGADGSRLALIANYALHPVIVPETGGIQPDFPGYLAACLESDSCVGSGRGSALGMFVQAGAGNVISTQTWAGSPDDARAVGTTLASAAVQAAQSVGGASSTVGYTIGVQRNVLSYAGLSNCDGPETSVAFAPDREPVTWDLESTVVVVRDASGRAVLAFATIPGEPFSGLQRRLKGRPFADNILLLGYANGYYGYFADAAANPGGYGVALCYGPVYFPQSEGVGEGIVLEAATAMADLGAYGSDGRLFADFACGSRLAAPHWFGKDGVSFPYSGAIAPDPVDPSNCALSFGRLTGGGDTFSALVTERRGVPTVLEFDYLGLSGSGAAIGLAEGFPGGHRWLAGTSTADGSIERGILVADGQWHHYAIPFDAFAAGGCCGFAGVGSFHVMMEDFDFGGAIPGRSWFDNVRVGPAAGFEDFGCTVPLGAPSWFGKYGSPVPYSGAIVGDPVDTTGNCVLTFTQLTGGGDAFGALVTGRPGARSVLEFDYLGLPGSAAVVGVAEGFPGGHRWLAGLTNYPDVSIEQSLLVADGQWHHYAISFDPYQAGGCCGFSGLGSFHVMLEDYPFTGALPGKSFFDDIQVHEEWPPGGVACAATLGAPYWYGKDGSPVPYSAAIVPNPLDPAKCALTFRQLTGGGDAFSAVVSAQAGVPYVLEFDYLGFTGSGAVIGLAEGFPGGHRWLAGTSASDGVEQGILVADGTWHHYAIPFDAYQAGGCCGFSGIGSFHVMLEDYPFTGAIAGTSFFDNVTAYPASP